MYPFTYPPFICPFVPHTSFRVSLRPPPVHLSTPPLFEHQLKGQAGQHGLQHHEHKKLVQDLAPPLGGLWYLAMAPMEWQGLDELCLLLLRAVAIPVATLVAESCPIFIPAPCLYISHEDWARLGHNTPQQS